MNATFNLCFVVPDGRNSIIDAVNPNTGRSFCFNETLEEVRARYPDAVEMSFDAWQADQIARQQTPLTWGETTRDAYRYALECLPPEKWIGGMFLVGEPCDHCHATGRPRFRAYREAHGVFTVSSRPITIAEFRQAVRKASCTHNRMIERKDDMQHAWECADCGHVLR